ncbi:hypothetical protein CDAR_433931 [Caerostris darwini]|uniref:Uncharacterized protein n=1 Tax=Caerostris darwini TaxID=1538125 RepID=A0AAV4QVE8_9ARAC|nr:hypothetical protein CDAR_433931 [Caerostris darwini]
MHTISSVQYASLLEYQSSTPTKIAYSYPSHILTKRSGLMPSLKKQTGESRCSTVAALQEQYCINIKERSQSVIEEMNRKISVQY